MSGEAVSTEAVELLAHLAGLAVPVEDVALLGAALSGQLASVEALDRLGLALIGPDPDVRFDPRWRD